MTFFPGFTVKFMRLNLKIFSALISLLFFFGFISRVPQFAKNINYKGHLLFLTVGGLSLFGVAVCWFWWLQRI